MSAIPAGYKQTEVGVIPNDWTAVQAGDIGRFRGGSGFPTKYQGATAGAYPFFKVSDMNNEGNEIFMRRANNYVSEPLRKQLGATAFPSDSIVFAKVGAAVFLERKKILAQPSCLDNNMAAFVLDASRADYRFIHCNLLHTKLGDLVSTTALPSLSGSVLSKIGLRLPPLPEQRAIAAALSDVDALLAKLDQLIVKKRDLKQAAMQQLLTGQTRLPGFSGAWEVKRLGEVLAYEQPTKYLVSSSEYSDSNDVPVLTAGKTFVLGFTSETKGIFADLPAIIFDDFTTATKFVTFPFKAKSSAMKILRPRNPSVNLRLVFEIMQLIDFKLGDHKRYWISEYSKLEVKLPGEAEQTAIATVLSDMDAELAALETHRDKTHALKQGMMQELLTGRIRLI